MEMLLELIFDIVFEGILELATNKRISKWVRYPLITLISTAYIGIIILISVLGFHIIQDTLIGGIISLLLVVFLIAMGISFYIKKIKSTD